jgi:hypothetical protein
MNEERRVLGSIFADKLDAARKAALVHPLIL